MENSPDHVADVDHVDHVVDRDAYKNSRGSYLNSHRALSALTREFTRLCDEVVERAGALRLPNDEKAVVRRSPERCILQLGPVAITLGWLRSTLDSVGDGQLLVCVWNGTIAGRTKHSPERPSATAQTAAVVWETTRIAEAASEETWLWRVVGSEEAGMSSVDLATECIERLQSALSAA